MTDKTKALVEALKIARLEIETAKDCEGIFFGNHYGVSKCEDPLALIDKALAAFEQPEVREMTVGEIAKELRPLMGNAVYILQGQTLHHTEVSKRIDSLASQAAKALAKLGTIRVKG